MRTILAAGQPQIWCNCPVMRSFVWFLGLLLLALAAMACLTYPVWQLLHPSFGFPFHRVADRLGMITLAVGFVLVARRLRLADRASLGYGIPAPAFVREAGIGLGIGIVLMGLIVAVMVALHLRVLRPGMTLNAALILKLAAQGLARGVAVALIEETFLRGAMWSGIARESGVLVATVLTSLIYALTHFVSSYHVPPDHIGWHSGIDMLAGSFGAFAHPGDIADAYICLFAVGVVLATVRMRTGNIAASLGLHAGWVCVITFVRETSMADVTQPLHGLLSRFDGVVGWLVCAWTVLVGIGLERFYRQRLTRRAAAMPAT